MGKFGKRDGTQESPPSFENISELPKLAFDNAELPQTEIYKTKAIHEAPKTLEYKQRVFDLVIKHIDLNSASRMGRIELRHEIERYIYDYTEEMRIQINNKEIQIIVDEIVNDMVGLGPLEILLNDPNINDIMVNSYDNVYVERKGLLQLTDVTFRNEKHVLQISQRIASQVGRRIDESSPMVDARLANGSRVNIIIPPLALNGTSISIRKFSAKTIHLKDMTSYQSISQDMFKFLKMAALGRLNIIVSGGTGAGKTTLLNALSELIDPKERIVTIEDAAELKLQQPHVVRLESRPANIEGQGMVTIRDLVKNALRMRPDRIIIGECRGSESFDMIQAMNTGHDGSMSTLHSNSTHEALSRLENMILMSGHELPSDAIRSYIVDAVDIIIQVSRMRDGVRRIVQISEVIDLVNNKIEIRDIFTFKHVHSNRLNIEGDFIFKGISDQLKEKLLDAGLEDYLKELQEGVE